MPASHARIEHEEFGRIAPAAQTALRALGKAVGDSGLEKSLVELLKVRASQINGCAFCLQLHLTWAREAGVPREKLDLVAAWREAGIYSPREMAALAWTESLTRTPVEGSDEAYAAVLEQFSPSEAVFLTVAIGTINQWNRIVMGLRFTPQIPA